MSAAESLFVWSAVVDGDRMCGRQWGSDRGDVAERVGTELRMVYGPVTVEVLPLDGNAVWRRTPFGCVVGGRAAREGV